MDDPPKDPQPFWRWDWKTRDPYGKAALGVRLLVKPLVFVAAVIGAAFVVVDAFPRVDHKVRWRNVEYGRIDKLHAGYTLDHFQAQIGPPTQRDALLGYSASGKSPATGFTEYVWVRREHVVQAVADASGQIAMFSVTSCDPAFQPKFHRPRPISESNEVRLQDLSLADATEAARRGTQLPWMADFLAPATGSTPFHYFEWSGPSSGASTGRSYLLGVNVLCLSPEQRERFPGQPPAYRGPIAQAPAELRAYRGQIAANLYAETFRPLMPAFDELGMMFVARRGFFDGECGTDRRGRCSRVTIGARWTSLPSGVAQGSTREP